MNKKIRPSIISTDEVRPTSPKPTVIGAESIISNKVNAYKPSVISSKEEDEVVVEQKPSIPTFGPSAIQGNRRNRLPITLDNINNEFGDLSNADNELILQLILETNIEASSPSSITLWQQSLQKSYSDQVMIMLQMTRHESLDIAETRVHRVLDILQSIDLRGVLEFNKDGFFTKFLKLSNAEYDSPEELQNAEKELSQLVEVLNRESETLLQLHQRLSQIQEEIKRLENRVLCAANAANYLIKYFEKQGEAGSKLSRQFEDRAMSLTKTRSQMLQNEAARKIQLDHLNQLLFTVQDVILVMLPDWLGSISAILSMLGMKKVVTLTEVMDLSDRQKKIISHLK